MRQTRQLFDWLIRHEKLLMALTFVLIVALIMQIRFCGGALDPGATAPGDQTQASPTARAPGPAGDLTGIWEMSIQKRSGGSQNWTLSLTQNGEALNGSIKSEGGDLPVSGTVKDGQISLSAKRYGTTVEFAARLDGELMTGTMKALMIRREWTARRR